MSDKKFRLNAKYLFLTYPQCPIPHTAAANLLETRLAEKIDFGLVGQESHTNTDGEGCAGQHLHAVLVLKKRCNYRSPRCLDLKYKGKTYHGKYEPARQLQKSLIYASKEGKVTGIKCDWKAVVHSAKMKSGTKTAAIASRIVEGASLKDVVMENPGFALLHLRKIMDFKRLLEGWKCLERPLLPWNGATASQEDPASYQVAKWVNSNFGMERKKRQRQLWLWGPTGTGKTHMVDVLAKHFKCFTVTYEGFWDGYCDDYDFVVFEEFNGQKKVTVMNQFVEGAPMRLPQKGVSPILKMKNLPVIVLSNSSISGVYSNVDPLRLQALEDRFLEVRTESGSRINLKTEFNSDGSSDEDTAPMYSSDEEEAMNF